MAEVTSRPTVRGPGIVTAPAPKAPAQRTDNTDKQVTGSRAFRRAGLIAALVVAGYSCGSDSAPAGPANYPTEDANPTDARLPPVADVPLPMDVQAAQDNGPVQNDAGTPQRDAGVSWRDVYVPTPGATQCAQLMATSAEDGGIVYHRPLDLRPPIGGAPSDRYTNVYFPLQAPGGAVTGTQTAYVTSGPDRLSTDATVAFVLATRDNLGQADLLIGYRTDMSGTCGVMVGQATLPYVRVTDGTGTTTASYVTPVQLVLNLGDDAQATVTITAGVPMDLAGFLPGGYVDLIRTQ